MVYSSTYGKFPFARGSLGSLVLNGTRSCFPFRSSLSYAFESIFLAESTKTAIFSVKIIELSSRAFERSFSMLQGRRIQFLRAGESLSKTYVQNPIIFIYLANKLVHSFQNRQIYPLEGFRLL